MIILIDLILYCRCIGVLLKIGVLMVFGLNFFGCVIGVIVVGGVVVMIGVLVV